MVGQGLPFLDMIEIKSTTPMSEGVETMLESFSRM